MPTLKAMQASHCVRLNFEKVGTILALSIIGIVLVLCIVAMWPADWAEIIAKRIVMLSGSIFDLVGGLGMILGLSWGRGHLDNRLKGDG